MVYNLKEINIYKIMNIILVIIGFFGISYLMTNRLEGFRNKNPAIFPSKLNKNIMVDTGEIQKSKRCRPVINCRRVGYFCSLIN